MGGDYELEEFTAKIGLPAWLAKAEFAGKWARRRTDRVEQVFSRAAELVSVEPHDLPELIDGSDERVDLLGVVLERAADVADDQYRDILAKLLAAACDDTRVDEVAYIARQVVRADPVDLRCFLAFFRFTTGDSGDSRRYEVVPPEQAAHFWLERPGPGDVASKLGIGQGVAVAAFRSLTLLGLLDERQEQGEKLLSGAIMRDDRRPIITKWKPSSTAKRLMILLFPDATPINWN